MRLLRPPAAHNARAPEVVPLSPEQIELIREIRASWGDTKEKNIKVGQCLAKLRLPKRLWRLNLFNLPMDYSWGKRLIKLSASERILANLDRMPDARSTLHEITLMRDREFELAMEQQIINPGCTRQDIRDFVRRMRGLEQKTHLTVTFEARGKTDDKIGKELCQLLASIEKTIDLMFPTIKLRRHVIIYQERRHDQRAVRF